MPTLRTASSRFTWPMTLSWRVAGGSIPRGGYVALGREVEDAVGADRGDQLVGAEGVKQVTLNQVYLVRSESVFQSCDTGDPGLDQIQFIARCARCSIRLRRR